MSDLMILFRIFLSFSTMSITFVLNVIEFKTCCGRKWLFKIASLNSHQKTSPLCHLFEFTSTFSPQNVELVEYRKKHSAMQPEYDEKRYKTAYFDGEHRFYRFCSQRISFAKGTPITTFYVLLTAFLSRIAPQRTSLDRVLAQILPQHVQCLWAHWVTQRILPPTPPRRFL